MTRAEVANISSNLRVKKKNIARLHETYDTYPKLNHLS